MKPKQMFRHGISSLNLNLTVKVKFLKLWIIVKKKLTKELEEFKNELLNLRFEKLKQFPILISSMSLPRVYLH